MPAGDFLERVHQALGFDSYRLVPTLFWISSSNAALMAVVAAGGVFSMLLILGFMPRFWLAPLFILYLSLVSAGQVFMAFQWDSLLLEVGFLAIFLTLPGPAVVFLFRALLFRFMFLSGAVKLLSGDTTWRGLTALNFHFETQPLPLFTSWYLHQLPEWFLKTSVVMVLCIELVVPFLIFAPRRLRFFAAACIAGLNLVIFLSGTTISSTCWLQACASFCWMTPPFAAGCPRGSWACFDASQPAKGVYPCEMESWPLWQHWFSTSGYSRW